MMLGILLSGGKSGLVAGESERLDMSAAKQAGNRRFFKEVELENGVREKVPLPPRPAMPEIPAEVRVERARKWLESMGQDPSADRIRKLSPTVGRFSSGTPLGRIADDLVAHNRLPSRRNVEAVYLRKRAIKQYLSRLGRERFRALLSCAGIEEAVLMRIDRHWQRFGEGPTWVEVADFADLKRAAAPWFIKELKKSNLVTFDESPRSLRTANRPLPRRDYRI